MDIPEDQVSFKITIYKTVKRFYEGTKEQLLEERHYTDQEINDRYNYIAQKDTEKYTKKIYTPVPALLHTDIETKVLEQIVETLDLKAVIRAVNS